MSFGRKGLAPGAIAPAPPRPAGWEAAPAPARAREAAMSDSLAAEPDYSSDPLAGLRNGARPATQRDDAVGQSWSPMPAKDARAAMQTRGRSDKRFIFGEPSRRSLLLAYVFWFIAGQGSLHRFYCGQSQSALMQIGLLVGSVVCGLIFAPIAIAGIFLWFFWIVADLFLMPGMMRRFKAEYATDYSGVFA